MADHERITDADILARLAEQINDIARVDAPLEAPMCECKCTGSIEPHSDRPCNRYATKFVRLHRWGFCEDNPDADGYAKPENVDADGNITAYMCSRCAGHALAIAWRNIRQCYANIPPGAGPPRCPTCNRPTTRGEDICGIEDIP